MDDRNDTRPVFPRRCTAIGELDLFCWWFTITYRGIDLCQICVPMHEPDPQKRAQRDADPLRLCGEEWDILWSNVANRKVQDTRSWAK